MNDNEQEELNKIGSESVLNEHLKDNIVQNQKKKLTKEELFTYVAMVLILIAAIVLIIMFLDKQGANPFRKSTTTAKPVNTIIPTEQGYVPPKTIVTTSVETKATHTYGTTNIDAGAESVPPTTFHTVTTANN